MKLGLLIVLLPYGLHDFWITLYNTPINEPISPPDLSLRHTSGLSSKVCSIFHICVLVTKVRNPAYKKRNKCDWTKC
jgi:hypothetical protein